MTHNETKVHIPSKGLVANFNIPDEDSFDRDDRHYNF